ncbi:MAG: hypothetical protein FJW20_23450 [Acidimicrobiia bacterium]|nr:hypothetical protein [Acidimicrobiia bacterium]
MDRQFCSDDHRRKARHVYSARLTRDLDSEDAFEDAWLVTSAPRKKSGGVGPASGILLVVAATVLVLFLPGGEDRPSAPPSYLPQVGKLGDSLSRAVPGSRSVSLREDFRMDLRNWQSEINLLKDGWTKSAGAVNIGSLRLWKPTLALTDYNMQFETEIERKAVNWAFRASNHENYYATKIQLNRSENGNPGRAEIIRYVMQNGKQLNKVELPIPVLMRADTAYEIRVRVKGDRFTTMVNGRLVDSWTDARFKRGGVGFFSESGEAATLRWVSVSDRESFLNRFLSFSFLIAPADLQPGLW